MQQGCPVPEASPDIGIVERLLREGWSLHQRLQVAPSLQDRSDALTGWRAVVAPDNPFISTGGCDGMG